ncbi:DUF4412 domain-containing protein [Mucilaginibacter phyllosphaerae]|uniref:DUF4412 domain-containing protein n=1 Tax=Mucilaginibacter phyllosphaerae TaxID=1812349 RepID=A0A4Y8AIC1_9SPHI|nr:DUF4412 domain-containing protein [Mucilaginibacter phyllosphaerae]MBB3968157.1 hypothetical protein [Mucilaginibacter phyllosphaerae]TEW68828.1 DUF4412 domain-containing protein [Mucilaginibacter phyllosphaerae]GGH00859.1 hypothetical protein GCM10007352_02330 [Mucilaginibacter phyllosphaerae]
MKIKLFTVATGLALTATAISASAQKAYKEGVAVISMNAMGQTIEAKNYFRTDSSAISFNSGPAVIKVLSDTKGTYMAVLIDVAVASMKKAAIATPAEVEEEMGKLPALTFAPGTETKVINGFNCKKVVATDPKTSKTYDIWVTNDVSLPPNAASKVYAKAGGLPIQYVTFQNGQPSQVTIKSIAEQKVPAGTFAIPADFDKITMDDLKSMSGGGN